MANLLLLSMSLYNRDLSGRNEKSPFRALTPCRATPLLLHSFEFVEMREAC